MQLCLRNVSIILLSCLVGCAAPSAKELGERYQKTQAPEDRQAWYAALDREGWDFSTRVQTPVDERGVYKINREARLLSLCFKKGFQPREGAWSEDVGEERPIDVSWTTHSNGAIRVLSAAPTNWEVYVSAYAGEVTRFGFKVMAAETNRQNRLPELTLPAGWRIVEGEKYTGVNFREAYFMIEKEGLKVPAPTVELTWKGVGVRRILGVTNVVLWGESATFTPVVAKPPTMLRTELGRRGALSVTHVPNVPGLQAGPHRQVPFPTNEIAACNNFIFALREGFRFFGFEKDRAFDGHVWLCGFDSNYPNGHTDFPAHFHIGISSRDGAQVSHFYPDAATGHILSNTYQDMTRPMDVWDRAHIFRPGDEWPNYDGRGRLVFWVKLLADGSGLRVRKADGLQAFEVRGKRPCDAVDVFLQEASGPMRHHTTISVKDDPLAGRLTLPEGVVTYDPDTGKTILR